MKYLKKFNLHDDYETYMDSQDLIYPNVSYCVDRNEVHFNPDPYNGHKYVDLGLPSGTLWATTNIGANSPEEYGLYFAWGETEGYPNINKQFTWADYKFNPSCDGTTMTKYNATDGLVQFDLEDDAATANWGYNWCMPTKEQFQELLDTNNCTNTWTTVNGVNGRMFTSVANGNTLFFPAAGLYFNGEIKNSEVGHYWSNYLYYQNSTFNSAYKFSVNNAVSKALVTSLPRSWGLPIRPVIYIEPVD